MSQATKSVVERAAVALDARPGACSTGLRAIAVLVLAMLWGCGRDVYMYIPPRGGHGGSGGGLPAGGAEPACDADLQTDPGHCGSCDRDCLGTACADGQCQPSVLASDLGPASTIAVDATHVYWRGDDPIAVLSLPVNGGEVSYLALGGTDLADSITVTSTHVYYLADIGQGDWRVMRVPKAGGDPDVVAADKGQMLVLAVDGEHVYWTARDGDFSWHVSRAGLAGGQAVPLATVESEAFGLAVDATHVYWSAYETGRIWKVPKAGGDKVLLAQNQNHPLDVAVHAGDVYWIDHGTPDPNGGYDFESPPPDGSVMRTSKDGGDVVTLVENQPGLLHLALDNSHVYWTQLCSGGNVMRMPLGGGEARVVGLDGHGPWGVALDETHVYWTSQLDGWGTGRVMKVGK